MIDTGEGSVVVSRRLKYWRYAARVDQVDSLGRQSVPYVAKLKFRRAYFTYSDSSHERVRHRSGWGSRHGHGSVSEALHIARLGNLPSGCMFPVRVQVADARRSHY